MSTDKPPYKTASATEPVSYEPAPTEPPCSRTRRLVHGLLRTLRRWGRELRKGCGLFVLGIVALAGGVACTPTTTTPPSPTQGSFSIDWAIQDQNRLFTTCEAVGAATVRFTLNDPAGSSRAFSFPCTATRATSAVGPGTYQVEHELFAANGTFLSRTAAQPLVVTAGQLTKLLPAIFVANTQGRLVLSLATPPNTSNCKTPGQGGAGITSNSLTLLTPQGACAPVTFVRARGDISIGTYQVSCSSPLAAACFERDETLTANLAPGTYALHVRGKIAGADCWIGDETIVVPPAGTPLIHPVVLTHQSLPGC